MVRMRLKRSVGMNKRHCGGRLLAAFLAVCMMITALPVGSFPAAAAGESQPITENGKKVYQITSFNDLLGAANYSRGDNWNQVDIYRLMNDISIEENEMSELGDAHLTFGTSDRPFCTEFDGGGYTISGLSYAENIVDPQGRTGLFSYTGREASKDVTEEDAYIHDLVLDGANIYADFDAGILIGDAYNTTVENVTVKNSTVHVFPANNVLTLVADGGVFGGGLAGYSKDSVFYNCEARNVSVLNNKTGAVQALGGKGLYLGGLVGVCDNTLLEYCRADGGRVSNYYDVAVGALGGNTLYVGGLVGKMRAGSQAVDCFATNSLNYYCANYVSVGSGTAGHAGGIAGGTVSEDGGESCLIKRCHFAGEITSEQINSILVLPVVIQYNVNRSGLVNSVDGSISVENSYFSETTTTAQRNGKSDSATTLGNDDTTDSYGPKDDSTYTDRSFWESKGYDFSGQLERSGESAYTKEHYNKWVMRYVTDEETGEAVGMPVHGKSVAGAFDFPGAGSVTVSPLAEDHLSGNVAATDEASTFAVLAFYPGEGKEGGDSESADGAVKIEFTPISEGYKLEKWYKRPSTTVAGVGGDISAYARIFGDTAIKTVEGNPLARQLVQDNDLYLARVQASVEFYDLTGNAVISSGWYHYNDKLPEVTPKNAPGSTVKLVGWTTEKPYASITSTQLGKLKQNGSFYVTGDPIQKTMKLYPVYANLLANAKVQIEGHDAKDPATRTGVGSVTVEGDGGKDVLRFTPEGGSLPDGFRFLGWYEKDAAGKWYRIGTEDTYSLENVDMTVEHQYEARLEYRVDYYAVTGHEPGAGDTASYPWNKPYAQLWQQYNTAFDSTVAMPADYHGSFSGWYEGKPTGVTDQGCSAGAVAAGKKITAPCAVHNHVTGTDSLHKLFVKTDFPGSGAVTQSGNAALGGKFKVTVTPEENYNFLFWAADGGSDFTGTSANQSWGINSAFSNSKDYGFEAHMTANAVFHKKDDTDLLTVQRRYQEKLFLTAAASHTYTYPLKGGSVDTSSLSNPVSGVFPARDSMKVPGYYFVGWADKGAMSEDEIAYLYDVKGDKNTCSSVEKALPYVLGDDVQVTRAMPDLYPVYVKYDIRTGTNIVRHASITSPADPTFTPGSPTGESAEITVTAKNNVLVSSTPGETEKFVLSRITVQIDGGEEAEIAKPSGTSGDFTVTYTVRPGHKYFFKAWYQPYTLAFHVKEGQTEVIVRGADTKVGTVPAAIAHTGNADLNGTLFVGWATVEPAGAYYKLDTIGQAQKLPYYASSAIQMAVVTRSCEFWPVYVKYNVTLGTSTGGTAAFQRSDDATTLKAVATPASEHTFTEWKDQDGKSVSKDTGFTVPDPFGGNQYTPVFETVYHVKYYAPNGTTVLHEDQLSELADKDTVLVTTEGEVLSAKPYSLIANEMQSGQHFAQWVWKTAVPGGTKVEDFESFCHESIVSQLNGEHLTTMELYPVVWNMTATADGGAAPAGTTITVGRSTGAGGQLSIRCSVPEDSTAHKIAVHVEKNTWRTGEEHFAIASVPVVLTSGSKRLAEQTDASGNAEFILNKKTVDIKNSDGTSITGKNETYDGTPKKGYEGTPTAEGYTGTFKEIYYEKTTDSENNTVWKEISTPVRAGDYKVKIAIPASDHEFEGSTEVEFKISPATVTIGGVTPQGGTYDGTEKTGYTGTPTVSGGYTGTFAVTYYDAAGGALPGKPTDAGTYKVKIAVPAAERNYTGATELTFTIDKADYTGRKNAYRYINSTSGSTVVVTLPILPDGARYDTVTDGSGGQISMTPVNASDRTVTVKNERLTTGTATFTVSVTGAKNYNDYTVTVTITPTSKTEVPITADLQDDLVYNGSPKTGYAEGSVKIDGTLSNDYELLYRQGDTTLGSAPTDVGKYTVKISVPDSDASHFGSVTLPFEITPKPLTDGDITGVTAKNAEYDGAEKPGYTGTPIAAGYTGGFKVTYYNNYADNQRELHDMPTNAGKYKVVFTPQNANYTGSKTLEFEITKKTVTVTATPQNAVYDGARKLGYSGTPSAGVYTDRLNFIYFDSEGNAMGDQPIHAGSYSVKIAVPDEVRNYQGETTVNFTISPKPVEVTGVTKKDGESDGRPKPGYTGVPTIPGYKGEFDIVYEKKDGTPLGDQPPVDTGEYKVIIKPSDPDYSGEKEIPFVITKKTVTVNATPQNSVYNGQKKPGYKGTPTATGYTGSFLFTYYDSKGRVMGDQPINVGSYQVKIAIPADAKNQSGETTLNFEITPKLVKIGGVTRQDGTADGTPQPGYSGRPTAPEYNGGFEIVYKDKDGNTSTTPPSEPGDYQVVIKPTDPNYTGETVIDFTISTEGDGTGHPVTIPDVDGAEVKSDHETAQPGEKVVITVTPEEGKKVKDVTVTDEGGNKLPVTDNGDGTWSFDMPDSGVTVEVTLVCPRDKTCPISRFEDAVPTEWYHDGVHYCIEEGLMAGYNARKFGPNDKTTRAHMVQILYNKAGRPAVKGTSRFQDVVHNEWYEKAIIWGDNNKVINGYSKTKFGPNDPITREQLAAILYRHAGSPATSGDISKFKDHKQTSNYAVPALKWAVENGIVDGRSSTVLAPAGNATRAEAACMIQRYLENYVGKKTETGNGQE